MPLPVSQKFFAVILNGPLGVEVALSAPVDPPDIPVTFDAFPAPSQKAIVGAIRIKTGNGLVIEPPQLDNPIAPPTMPVYVAVPLAVEYS